MTGSITKRILGSITGNATKRVTVSASASNTKRIVGDGPRDAIVTGIGSDTWGGSWGGIFTNKRTWGKTWFNANDAFDAVPQSPAISVTKRVTEEPQA